MPDPLDTQTQEERIRPVGTSGKVHGVEIGGNNQPLWSNGVGTLNGSDRAQMINSLDSDDVIFARGAMTVENKPATDHIDGGEGYDIAVLPGQREDYTAKLPDATNYPAATGAYWKDHDHAYGKSVIMENVNSGEKYSIDGVERIAFEGGDPSFQRDNPRILYDTAQGFHEKIESGEVSSVSTQEVFLQAQADLSPEEVTRAKIASTKEMAEFVSGKSVVQLGLDGVKNAADEKATSMIDAGYDTSAIQPIQPDAPVSEKVSTALKMDMAPR